MSARHDWSQQSERLWQYLFSNQGKDIPAPAMNRAAAGEGQFVSSLSKRVSECRRKARALGGDLVLSRDEWENGRRYTHYRLTLP